MPTRKKTAASSKRSVKTGGASKTATRRTLAGQEPHPGKDSSEASVRAREPRQPNHLTTSVTSLTAKLQPRPAFDFRVPVRRPDDLLVFDLASSGT